MQRLEHRDQHLFVNHFFLGAQRLAALQLFEHVVHAGQRQPGVLRLLALAVRVELLGEVADAGLLLRLGGRKGKVVKARPILIARIIANAHSAASSERPTNMRPR